MLLTGALRAKQPSTWRRASFCQAGECIEIAQRDGVIFIRNSREPRRQALRYTPEEWQSFIRGVKAGEFDDFGT